MVRPSSLAGYGKGDGEGFDTMRQIRLGLLLFGLCAFYMQAAESGSPALTPVQKQGRRLFDQRCSVCHTAPTVNARLYGPRLTKEMIVGNEDAVRQQIMNGSDRMPGFRYGLTPAEIHAIIEYIKTGMEAGQSTGLPEKSGS